MPQSPDDYVHIETVSGGHVYYGKLEGYTHVYRIEEEQPFELRVQALMPPDASNPVNVLIVKQEQRGVSEVARMLGSQMLEETYTDPVTGVTYAQGQPYEGAFEKGAYLIEISTKGNVGTYALKLGEGEEGADYGYFERFKHVAAVRSFFGMSEFSVFTIPFVYVPLLLFVFALGGYLVYRNRRSTHITA